ncbi:MAG: nucleotidyl transferase AbiEii/AbiGii toxin family protein [Deltaproteobacteria bacterium]|nr:nucleotidyl transferase AbiEii/AbiGii toxin family protein [Deltaproteobacteria bacterium]
MSALADTLRCLATVLDERDLRWFVFGAQAVAVRGAPRTTQDLDVTVEVDRAQLPELMGALEAQGLRHRYPDITEELLTSGSVLPLAHTSGMEIDLVLAGSGLEAIALARATRVSIDRVEVPVAHATDLVVMKVLAGRGKDLDDVRALLASGDVELAEARDLLGQLEEALGQSDLLPLLQEAVDEVGDV